MAELVGKLHQLKCLPDDLHWFCPRQGSDDSYYFEEDLLEHFRGDAAAEEERVQKVAEATARKTLVLDALQILAYDGADAASWQKWLKERLDVQLSSCDVCIRMFHRGRKELKDKLDEQYDEEEVSHFLKIVDDVNIERIKRGLAGAEKDLLEAPPQKRGITALDSAGLYAVFETLSCEAFLKNETLLSECFDKPFSLIQTNKRLKLNNYTPAMTTFLFSFNEDRRSWAFMSWSRFRRNITRTEFDFMVKEPLFDAMTRVQLSALDPAFVPLFWDGVKVILGKLDQELITHSLRALDIDICKLALEHLQLDTPAFGDLLTTIQQLLVKSPTDFWDAMGAISPVTIVEQIFHGPAFENVVLHAHQGSVPENEVLDEIFSWVDPFLSSIKVSNRTPACRALANQLMTRLQSDKFSRSARKHCYKLGLEILAQTLRSMGEDKSGSGFVGAANVSDALDVVGQYIDGILMEAEAPASDQTQLDIRDLSLEVIQLSLYLDCFSLAVERENLIRNKPLQHETRNASSNLWDSVIRAIRPGRLLLASKALLGSRGLIGIEKLLEKPGSATLKQNKHFNATFERVSHSVQEILERLSDLSPSELEDLFKTPESTSGIVVPLLSAETGTHQAAVDVLKVISSQTSRREALGHVLVQFYSNALSAFSSTVRRVAHKRAFAPTTRMLRLSADIIDLLCNGHDGLLRSRSLDREDAKATESLWIYLWQALIVIFDVTEEWSYLGHRKTDLEEFCRDTMQFADRLFDEYGIFANALKQAYGPDDKQDGDAIGRQLLQHATRAMNGMAKWLRLRDEYLISKSVALTSKLLKRLYDVSIEVPEQTLVFIHDIVSGKIRSKLSQQQQAELERALETHSGVLLEADPQPKSALGAEKQGSLNSWVTKDGERRQSKTKDQVIDLEKWKSKAEISRSSRASSAGKDSDDSDGLKKIISDSSRAADLYKARLQERQAKKLPIAPVNKNKTQPPTQDATDFKRKREEEREAKRKRDALAIAAAKKNFPLRGAASHTAEAGSALAGLGVAGKDHAIKGTGMMVSSGEESEEDEEDALDRELFGLSKDSSRKHQAGEDARAKAAKKLIPQPVKKMKLVRSSRDMRARLAPDLSPLHKVLLSWDYFHEGDFPPNSGSEAYTSVPNTFRTPIDYQNTFQPLLTLEAWQGFVKAREESNFKPYEIKVVNRSSVDAFVEVSTTMTHAENKDLQIMEGDIALLSKARNPAATTEEPHCLSRVYRVNRKKNLIEVLYRVIPGNPLISSLAPSATVYGVKIHSITPLEREYGALLGLQYYDLCEEIIRAKPSPLLNYTEMQLKSIIDVYKVNVAQAKAVKSAIDNDAFTLIQGPPGSGKTKTIVAIVGAILTPVLHDKGTVIERPSIAAGKTMAQMNGNAPPPKKLLVCAPSNAAVDELVMRFKEGVRTLNGQHKKISVVRLGRSEAINSNILDVTLDELVNARLGAQPNSAAGQREETQNLMKEHQAISEKLRESRAKLDAGDAKGKEAAQLKEEFEALRRRKTQLSTQIDSAKDNENQFNRQAELNRKRAQQAVLDQAHVICATLSGSGHEMFQNVNIEFETVIVDEAAQCVEMSALIPLKYGCAKCILVGDPKQLPPTVFSREAARFQYEQSLFVRMQGNHPDDVHLLDTQYRMHPDISRFPSQAFYDGRLLDGGDMASLRQRPWHTQALLGPYRFFDVQGQHQAAPKGHSLINLAEIEVAMLLFERLTSAVQGYDFRGKIGVITPYKSQLRELKDRFSRKFGQSVTEMVEFNTTDAFQGRESEVIIFSCVRASPAGGIGFLQDIRRMNVGLTRAKSSLWVLGNSNSLIRGEYWQKLVGDSRSRGLYTEGDIKALLRNSMSTIVIPTGPRAEKTKGQEFEPERQKSTSIVTKIKAEEVSRSPSVSNSVVSSRRSSFDQDSTVSSKEERKGRVDEGHKVGPTSNDNRKRKASVSSDEDVEMKDAPLELDFDAEKAHDEGVDANAGTKRANGTSVQPPANGPPKESKKPGTNGLAPTAASSHLKPMAPRKKKTVDPFIRPNRPKKPKAG